jgi:hypothetical protein
VIVAKITTEAAKLAAKAKADEECSQAVVALESALHQATTLDQYTAIMWAAPYDVRQAVRQDRVREHERRLQRQNLRAEIEEHVATADALMVRSMRKKATDLGLGRDVLGMLGARRDELAASSAAKEAAMQAAEEALIVWASERVESIRRGHAEGYAVIGAAQRLLVDTIRSIAETCDDPLSDVSERRDPSIKALDLCAHLSAEIPRIELPDVSIVVGRVSRGSIWITDPDDEANEIRSQVTVVPVTIAGAGPNEMIYFSAE